MTPDERAELVELWRQRQVLSRAEGDMSRRVKALAKRAGLPLNDPYIVLAGEPFLRAGHVLHVSKLSLERRLKTLVKTEPVWQWAVNVRGLAELSVAAVLAECGGDLSTYATHSRLWKRFGLAVSDDGGAQRCRTGPLGTLEGFSPERRHIAHNLALSVLRSQTATQGPYRLLYDSRKAYELQNVSSRAHAEARTLRYLAKRILRDLWRARRDLSSAGL
jgi:hypothetical protein